MRNWGKCLGNGTICLVAVTDDLRVKNVRKQIPPKWDVVRPSWIHRCVASDCLLPFRPEDMLVTSPTTAATMKLSFDEYGNSLVEPTTEEQVKFILNRVKELVLVSFNLIVIKVKSTSRSKSMLCCIPL